MGKKKINLNLKNKYKEKKPCTLDMACTYKPIYYTHSSTLFLQVPIGTK